MSQTIAIVEDDPQQREHYAQALRELGYLVEEYEDRNSAIASFEHDTPDLAILDIILGNEVGGGFEVCRFLKQKNEQIPVIFLTTRGDELDKIYGLQLGAWDYQTKPISLDFLVTRVESLFRIIDGRIKHDEASQRLGELTLDALRMTVQWKGQPIALTPTEFEILKSLVENPNGASIEDLVRATRQGLVEDNTINTHILHIRKKFKQVDADFKCIKTRYGFGYSWVCE